MTADLVDGSFDWSELMGKDRCGCADPITGPSGLSGNPTSGDASAVFPRLLALTPVSGPVYTKGSPLGFHGV